MYLMLVDVTLASASSVSFFAGIDRVNFLKLGPPLLTDLIHNLAGDKS